MQFWCYDTTIWYGTMICYNLVFDAILILWYYDMIVWYIYLYHIHLLWFEPEVVGAVTWSDVKLVPDSRSFANGMRRMDGVVAM